MRCFRLGFIRAIVAAGLLAVSNSQLNAGNIFDDDWTPPRRSTSQPAVAPRPTPPAVTPPVTPDIKRPEPPAKIEPVVPAGPAALKPQPIPSSDEQAIVRKLFKDVYSKQLADQTPAGRRTLARSLIADAIKASDAPVDQFVMLSGARKAAVEAGDADTAVHADAELCRIFTIDSSKSHLELLRNLSKTVKGTSACALVVKECFQESADCETRSEFDAAKQYADAALAAAKNSGSASLLARTSARAAAVRDLAAAYSQLEKPLANLRANPADAEASLAIGRFYCLMAGQWSIGLPYLAAGSDAKLRGAAKADMEGRDAAAIAGTWQGLAETENPAAKRQMRRRAADWCTVALASAQGLMKVKIEKQIADLNEGPFRADAVEVQISTQKLPDVLLRPGEGFAALASINGRFEGGAESAGVVLRSDGSWEARCHSNQGELAATFISYPRSDGLRLCAEEKEYQWRRGDAKVKMIARNEGICFLSFVSGHFERGGERVGISIGPDGFWYLDCSSQQDMVAKAISIKPLNGKTFATDVREIAWKRGSPPIAVMRQDEGICFLSMVQGGMRDMRDKCGLRLGDDGVWYLEGSGHVTNAKAMVIRFLR